MPDDAGAPLPKTAWPVAILTSSWAFPGAFLAFGLLLFTGAKQFSLWKQITDLWGASPWEAIVQLHFHAPRLILMQPVLWLAKTGVDQDLAFGLMCWLCLGAGAWLLARTAGGILRRPARDYRFLAFLGLALPSLVMYGRVVPAFLATVLILAIARDPFVRPLWRYPGLAFAALLGSVSSGTFAVVVALLLVAAIWPSRTTVAVRSDRWRQVRLAGGIMAGLVLVALTVAYADKALRCFDGDPWQLLTQGWGKVILDIRERGGSAAALILLALGGLWSAWWCARGAVAPHTVGLSRVERAALVVPAWVGLTGYNSFALIIPAAVLGTLIHLGTWRVMPGWPGSDTAPA